METCSQASQDLFYLKSLNYKRDGHFLEIGSNHPIFWNNTYLAETKYNWKGIMVEYDTGFAPLYTLHRPNSIHILNDAQKVDYRRLLDDNNFPVHMDYLQIDLDVENRSTLNVLELLDRTVFDKYTFATVTFEHDIYRGDFFDTRETSRKIFADRGYILAFSDVSLYLGHDSMVQTMLHEEVSEKPGARDGGKKSFEDWYIHPSLLPHFDFRGNNLYNTDIINSLW